MTTDKPISKNSALPAINLGLAIALVAFIWMGAQRVSRLESTVEDTAGRQSKYVGQSGVYTQEIDRLEELMNDLENRIIVLETTP